HRICAVHGQVPTGNRYLVKHVIGRAGADRPSVYLLHRSFRPDLRLRERDEHLRRLPLRQQRRDRALVVEMPRQPRPGLCAPIDPVDAAEQPPLKLNDAHCVSATVNSSRNRVATDGGKSTKHNSPFVVCTVKRTSPLRRAAALTPGSLTEISNCRIAFLPQMNLPFRESFTSALKRA